MHSRADIMFAFNLLSRFMHSRSTHHFGATKIILRYTKRIFNYGIYHAPINNLKLYSYIDSDRTSCADDG